MVVGAQFNGEIHTDKTTIAKDVSVKVVRVVHFKQFKDEETSPAEQPFLIFGVPEEAFVAHRLVHYPDFDQIFSVKFDEAPAAIPTSVNVSSEEYQVIASAILFDGTSNAVTKTKGEGDGKTHEWDMVTQGTSVSAVSANPKTLVADGKTRYKFRLERTISEGAEISRQY
jgi:hypothetical protein